jgi:hypothetical protein
MNGLRQFSLPNNEERPAAKLDSADVIACGSRLDKALSASHAPMWVPAGVDYR